MKKYILLFILSAFVFNTFAQEEKEKDQPVSNPFESGTIIDAQTTVIPDARTLEFIIQHKFGPTDNGISDLWGLYADGANIRLALNYVPFTNVQLGMGLTKNKMMTDLNAKWTILKQTERNTVPVSVALYGVVGIDGRSEDLLVGSGDIKDSKGFSASSSDIKLTDRASYFSQLIVGRKFNDWLSVQVGGSFTHYNLVPLNQDHDPIQDHNIVGLHFDGRVKISPQSSLLLTYDLPLEIDKVSEQTNMDNFSKPNLALGLEIFTFTHAFQIHVGTARGIIPQEIMANNHNTWGDGVAIGFTITRLWMF